MFIVSFSVQEVDNMKKTINIQFKNYDMIEKFSKDISDLKGEFDLISGRRVIDAKSFLGIFSLDLSSPLVLNAVTDDTRAFEVFSRYQV